LFSQFPGWCQNDAVRGLAKLIGLDQAFKEHPLESIDYGQHEGGSLFWEIGMFF
jgi:hypothetical protein